MRTLLLLIAALSLPGCTNVFFQPHKTQYMTPDKIGLVYEDVYFDSTDGVKLHGWWLPAKGKAKGTILFLHGNAENISTHIASVHWLPAQQYNVFLPDYRGYGKSEGSPSLAGAQMDINSAMKYVLQRPEIDTERIVVLAQSLGGAMSLFNVAHSPYRHKIKALITDSAFSDYRGIVREKLGVFWLTWPLQWPLSYTVDNDYSPMVVADKISPIPLLIIHGDQDQVVPLSHGQALFDRAMQPKEMWVVEGGRHIDAFRQKKYQEQLLAYITRILSP
jgi:hypothetical protein